jgi:hypothetical protein
MWDANMILDKEFGHMTSSFKAIFSRVIPGLKEWRVCIDGNKKYIEEHFEAEATVAVSHSAEPKCTKEEKVMEISVKGEKLDEQKESNPLYGECLEHMWSDIHELNSYACFLARDSFRKWTYDINTMDVPETVSKYLKGYMDWMKSNYMKYLTTYEEAPEGRGKESWQIVHEYPIIGNMADLHIYSPSNDIKFGGIPTKQYPMHFFHMLATEHISPLYRFMHMVGWTQTCEIHPTSYTNTTMHTTALEMPNDWTLYWGVCLAPNNGIWMKNLNNGYSAMKLSYHDHVLEIIPTASKKYDVSIDGKKLGDNVYQYDHKFFWLDMVKDTGVFNVFCKHTGSHVNFDGHHVLYEQPNLENTYRGLCA